MNTSPTPLSQLEQITQCFEPEFITHLLAVILLQIEREGVFVQTGPCG